MVVLFVDLLGTKSKWHAGGRDAAQSAFHQFATLVTTALASSPAGSVLRGGVESDACAIVFLDVIGALECAKAFFRRAFRSATSFDQPRTWVRGAITSFNGAGDLRTTHPIAPAFPHVAQIEYDGALLDAIAVEKSGFKGMRLLVAQELLTEPVKSRFRIPLGNRHFMPFRKLNHSPYPGRVNEGYSDYLWMVDAGPQWLQHQMTMSNRLRWAVHNNEEFIHAASTQVVFNECAAILSRLGD